MERRAFLSWVGVGFLASSLPVAIAACSADPTDTAEAPSAPNGNTPLNVGTVTTLDQQGFLLDESQGTPIMVVRDPANPEQLIAVNAACPHRNCTVDWEASSARFDCECHGSQFSPEGEVLAGPANRPLSQYAVTLAGDSVLVTL